tara:strand:- start:48 stop:578 length:531 start_codon:yes stop_codon:yes gene_type:complete
MENIPLEKAARLIYPRLTVLVTTKSSEGKNNAAPYSWIAPVSFKPPMVYLGIQRRETLTIKNMRETKEFVVNIVTKDWAKKAIYCGNKDENKIENSGLEFKESKIVKAPTVKDTKIALECKLHEIIETEKVDHYIVIGEIVNAEKDPEIKDDEITLHKSGSTFVTPGTEFEVERKR